MSDGETAVWLVAGGEPGAERFGHLVQRLRKDQGLSVEAVAQDAELSVGTIRAVEQARRAPSMESGIRLLQRLLPEGSVEVAPADGAVEHGFQPDVAFSDPASGARILVEFKAKTAGDNRRWSSGRPVAGETRTEAFIREMMADPERKAAWQQSFREHMLPALGTLGAVLEEVKARADRPADDSEYGGIVRQLATANTYRLQRISNLLHVWDRAENAAPDDDWATGLARQLNDLLDSFHVLSDEERAAMGESEG